MVKILLKKQLYEINQSFFYNRKKGTARSKTSSVIFIVFFVLLMLVVLGGIFGGLSVALGKPLISADLGWMYYCIMTGIAIMLGVFGSVFNTYSSLYNAKDNDLLLSMPIPVKDIIISRLLGVYLMGLMYSGIVIIPSAIVYLFLNGLSFKAFLGSLMLVINISVFVFVLSCALGLLVAKITLKLKNKSFITVLSSLVFIGVYYFCYFKASSVITSIIKNAAEIGGKLKANYYPVYFTGKSGEGDIVPLLCVTGVVAVLFYLTYLLVSKSFLKIAISSASARGKIKKEKVSHLRPVKSALLAREFRRYTSSAPYMLNCGLGSLLIVMACAAILIKAKTVRSFAGLMGNFGGREIVYFVIAAMLCFVSFTNDITAPSVSLEGKSFWIIRSLPVKTIDILKAKLELHIILTSVPLLICSVIISVVLRMPVIYSFLTVVLTQITVLLSALFGLYMNALKPNFNFANETVVVKQSLCVFFNLVGGWCYTLVTFGVYWFFRKAVNAGIYMLVLTLISFALCVLLYKLLKTNGVKRIESL